GERRELLEFQPIVDLDQIASGNGYEFREAAVWSKPRPTHVGADMCIADLAMTAGAIAPSRHDDDVVALLKSGRLGNDPADLMYDAGDLMTKRDGRRDIGILPEVSVHELHVGAAHSARCDLNENFIGLNIRNRHVLEDERLAIFVHACCFHVCSPSTVVGI